MIENLLELADDPPARAALVAEGQALVEVELAGKPGLAATGLRLAHRAVASFAPGYYTGAVDRMVPAMLEQLQPFWTGYRAAGGGSFGDYLVERRGEVGPALLTVTDDMAADSGKVALVKAYGAVRGGARRHIEDALPALGALIERYAADRRGS